MAEHSVTDPLVLAAQALFTRFNDPRMWDKLDAHEESEWLNLTAHVIAVWDSNVRAQS